MYETIQKSQIRSGTCQEAPGIILLFREFAIDKNVEYRYYTAKTGVTGMDILKSSSFFQEDHFPVSVLLNTTRGTQWSRKTFHSEPAFPKDYHTHEFSELVIMKQGEVDHYWEGGKVRLKRGRFLLLHPGMLHAYSNSSRNAEYYNLIYDSTIPLPMLVMSDRTFLREVYPVEKSTGEHKVFNGIVPRLPEEAVGEVLDSLEKIAREVRERRPGYHILITLIFMEIVLTLSRYYPEKQADDPKWALNKVIGFMKCHYSEKLSVKTLARIAGMSESTLFRKFSATFGVGPAEYLNGLRIRQAVSLLKNREPTLSSVAQECGFCDSSHLWKVLNRTLHRSPGEIRGESPDSRSRHAK